MKSIFELLDAMQQPYFRYGTVPDSTPVDFFTFFNVDTYGVLAADNNDWLQAAIYDVCYYSEDPEKVYEAMDGFVKFAKSEGWIVIQYPKDIATNEPRLLGRMARVASLDNNHIAD